MAMCFYGIIFGVSALAGNVFLNMFLLSVLEVPITLFTACLIGQYVVFPGGGKWWGGGEVS